MKSLFDRAPRTLVLVSYQDAGAARTALRALRRARYYRSASIHAPRQGPTVIEDFDIQPVPGALLGAGASAAALLICGLIFPSSIFGHLWLAISLTGPMLGLLLALALDLGIDDRTLDRIKPLALPGETIIVVDASAKGASELLHAVTSGEGERPLVFSLPELPASDGPSPRARLPATPDELSILASRLAKSLAGAAEPSRKSGAPWERLRKLERALDRAHDVLTRAAGMERSVAISAEWLLDNAYVIQGHIEDVRRNLSSDFFRALNAIAAGPDAGLTRSEVLARELTRAQDARLDKDNIHVFLQTFQTESVLTIAELWAVPQMLRLALIEHIAVRSEGVVRRQRESEAADFWANRVLWGARRAPERLPAIIAELARTVPKPAPHFAEEIIRHLYDEENALPSIRIWLESAFPASLNEVLMREQRAETAEQVSLANAITSLRLLTQLDWRKTFEAVSAVDAVLSGDPAEVYLGMDFTTRDRYRHIVEEIARGSRRPEEEVAQTAVELSLAATGLGRHVGYFLVDDGAEELRARFPYRRPLRQRLEDGCRRRPSWVYLLGITFVAAAVWAGCMEWMKVTGSKPSILLGMGALLFLPSVEIGVQVINYLVGRLIPPRPLPKLNHEDGIPDDCRTLVVVPTLLTDAVSTAEEVERLEIRYLANPDTNLRFAILSDFTDGSSQHEPSDDALLAAAESAVRALNARHGSGKFLLFHRDRIWCESERCWMGWERKRGKIEQLNRLLCEDPATVRGEGAPAEPGSLEIRVGSRSDLVGVRYVITLDSDTQLPRETARRLVEAISHPLNRPELAPDGRSITRGYSVIQPRISTSLPSATATRFASLFTNPSGIDPYTQVVSDVYQDLGGQASYLGKGIYDVAAFHAVLSSRFPPSRLLSHDLIEGEYARVGLASDIELLELFPSDYPVYCGRDHRWVRGDWQIAEWLLPRVPDGAGGWTANPLNVLSRWKILDNLRRSLTPLSCTLLLVLGCYNAPLPEVCALIVGLIVLAPAALQLTQRIMEPWLLDPMVYLEPAVNAVRAMVYTAILPHQSFVALDAIGRVLYRKLVSHHLLLEWQTFHAARRRSTSEDHWILINMGWAPPLALGIDIVLTRVHPHAFWAILPFTMLWMVSPILIEWLGRPGRPRGEGELTTADRHMLRQVARQTWRFFDTFVGPDTHWLPPDNYQELLRVEVANRTSPTNIGLWLLANLSARDFGYITDDEVVHRTSLTMATIARLTMFEGHLLNWYDTETLAPLGQAYVSMVDSGNLLGSLWAFAQGVDEIANRPILDASALRGVADTVALLKHIPGPEQRHPKKVRDALARVDRLLENPPESLVAIMERFRALTPAARKLAEEIGSCPDATDECCYWASQLERQTADWNGVIDRYLCWLEALASPPEETGSFTAHVQRLRREALRTTPSLAEIGTGEPSGLPALRALREEGRSSSAGSLTPALSSWLDQVEDLFEGTRAAAHAQLDSISLLREQIDSLDAGMDMSFLYDKDRRHFVTGFNVVDRRLDRSYYDLLASEARLGSLVAIARGDVRTEHWWALGRPFGRAYMLRPLLSWNGTMFEYLMPLLLTRQYANSLLDQACITAVACQRAFAKHRNLPWGVSEAAFSALDARQVYQYRAFGVPGLGLKRGLEEDLVVAPYASALALAVEPGAAVRNLRRLSRLARMGIHGLRGGYGYYESIDYTRHHGPHGERGVIVYAYMAHHQGMILCAIDNALNGNVLQERFHADPRVRATESLLFERVPIAPPLVRSYPRETGTAPLAPIPVSSAPGRLETADTPVPRAHLLSNGNYHLMITNAGGGYSRWKDMELTRWRSDTTRDCWGAFCYLRDVDSGRTWSAAYHPTGVEGGGYHATFSPDKAEFRRRDSGIDTLSEIVVCPEHDVEVRRFTLTNRTPRTRRIEVTSYAELSLAPHVADRAHPAFNKLFIQTDALPDLESLLAWRRPRNPEDPPVWAFHTVAVEHQSDEPAQFETDRARFIGRGRTAARPIALTQELSGTVGFVLDPIFSLRRTVVVEPGQHAHVCFITGAAETREEAVSLAEHYRDPHAAHRAIELAWTRAQIELRHLRIEPDEAQLFQQIAGYVLYPHAGLRAPAPRMARNVHGQSKLWSYGISGDLPIVVVAVGDSTELDMVRETLQAHTFWRVRGLKVDLLILNQESASYEQPLQNELARMVAAHTSYTGVDQPGGVYLRPAASIPEEDLTLLLASARVVLIAARGSLSQQTGAPQVAPRKLPVRSEPSVEDAPSPMLPFLELPYFNGLGGFSRDGREYVIYLGPEDVTPAPWINVIANPRFGTLVSESGSGFTWSGNSQMNRLTPWSNDPISDPPADVIYIRDHDLGQSWTPTALPIREHDAYRARHGQGYTRFEHNSHGLEQELTVFVPVDGASGDPVRIQLLRLKNHTDRARRLTVTFYAEWVLGTMPEESGLHVVTHWDLESDSLLARNAFRPDYPRNIAFAAATPPASSFSGDRTEVLGRNGVLTAPAALESGALSGRTGAGFDPCVAMQVDIRIEPGDEQTLVFLTGEASDLSAARELLSRYRDPRIARVALERTTAWWDDLLGTIQVKTPDLAVDLLLNRWLLYQTLSCRIWGRSAFYQSGGAFGFRDQLQDVMALVYSAPQLVRTQILLAASRQFPEGDVQHWWHPPGGAGVRTRISDDLLWLPFVTAHYVRVTGDLAVLDEQVPFLEGRTLADDEHEAYFVPDVSAESATLLEHCRRTITHASSFGPHGLPHIGGGDWNDGMNRVGAGGTGESIWLAWFLIHVLNDFAELLRLRGDEKTAEEYATRASSLAHTVEETAWDGEWYLRAFFDNGTPLGSHTCTQAKIDSLPQSWAVLSGAARPDRARTAMQAVLDHLVLPEDGMIRLFDPPFDHHEPSPGYIQGYPPGVRENGGQYTHGSLWVPAAFARMGRGKEAVDLLRMLNPVDHTHTLEDVNRYCVEPYVVAADVYALPGRVGRGGWTWYTGSSGWMYRVWLEEVLGFRLRGDQLTIDPSIHPDWAGFEITFRHRTATYRISVENPDHAESGVEYVEVDGARMEHRAIALLDDGREHTVTVRMSQPARVDPL